MRLGHVFSSSLFALCGCGAYHLPMPSNFQPEQIAVTGNEHALRIDDWQLSGLVRSSNARMQNADYAHMRPGRQEVYRFTISDGKDVDSVHCTFSAGRLGGVGPNTNFIFEDEDLSCSISGASKWLLDVANNAQVRLTGRLQGKETYDVIAEAPPGGPVTGFYIMSEGETLAAVQLADSRQVFFAKSLNAAQRAALVPALAALLLLDEKVHGV